MNSTESTIEILPRLPAGQRLSPQNDTTTSSQKRGGWVWAYRLLLFSLPFFILWPFVSYGAHLKVKDEVGREVIVPFPPKRIISLAPNVTEILFTLGLDEEIVGVSTHCNFPEKAKTKPRIGSYISLDFERIISLRPDFIIATAAGNTREMVKRLEEYGFPTYVIFPKNFDGILLSIEHIGRVVGREKEALAIVQGMKRRREKVIEITRNPVSRTGQALPQPRVFLQIGEAPIVTAGKGSFADDLIRLAGGENVAGDEKKMYPRFGMEEIIKRAPEIILISTHNPNVDYQKVLQEWSRWKTIPAVKTGRIHLINSDLIDRPSPRIIDGLEEMARIFHPEQFKKK